MAPEVAESAGGERPAVSRELLRSGVLLLTFDRPERKNSWNTDIETQYFGHLEAASSDPDVRAIVVTGAGTTFCPGMDMSVLDRASGGGPSYASLIGTRRPQTFALTVPKPVIAAVNGACAGVGYVQALMCDVRFAVPAAKLTPAMSRRGLIAEDALSWLLPRLVGLGRAADLLLSGRVITGAEAHRYGLVQELCEFGQIVDRAVDYATDLAVHCSPHAMALTKHQLHADLESSLEQARQRSLALLAVSRAHADYREGVASFVERRPPTFEGYAAGLLDPEAIDAGRTGAHRRS
jgi:enoyl-CoA hydratase/carnithine racemase